MTWETEFFEGYNYPYSERAIKIRFLGVVLEGPNGDRPIDASRMVVALHEEVEQLEAWERLVLRLDVLLAPGHTSVPWLQVICEDTRLELLRDLSNEDLSNVAVTVPIDDLRGAVIVRVLGIDRASPEDGVVNADSELVLVQVDPPQEPFGGGLKTIWQAEYFESRGIENALTCLDFPASGEPCLYLNSGVRDFQDLLLSKAPHGRVATARKLLFDWIESETWLALARRAASDVFRVDDTTGDVILENPDLLEAWQGAALKRVSRMLGNGNDPDGLAESGNMLLSAESHETVRAAIGAAVGQGHGLRRRVEQLAAALGTGEEG